MKDYEKVGAVKRVFDPENTRHLVPWFIISKGVGENLKHRLISDCRELNTFFTPHPFRLDHMRGIYPYLKQGQWGAKIDLKDAYFHMAVDPALRPYLRMKIEQDLWEFQGACFGLNVLPYLFTRLIKPLEKIWRSQGILIFVYLDDILLLGASKKQVEKHLDVVTTTLLSAGFKINLKKSYLAPSQEIVHLGYILKLGEGRLVVPPTLKSIRKEVGKLVTKTSMSCRKMASILGQVRAYLTALPCLRVLTDELMAFTHQHTQGWDSIWPIPTRVRDQARELKEFLSSDEGLPFTQNPSRLLHSDSSTHAWGGIDETGGVIQEFWRDAQGLHINIKELSAAISTVRSFAKPGETVTIKVDNTVALSYLQKQGGRKINLNRLIKPFLLWCRLNKVQVRAEWVPTTEQKADSISRWTSDPGDYTLNLDIFHRVVKKLQPWVTPNVDMFASPGNHKFPKFVTRWPHYQAIMTDALTCNLSQFNHVYANPPWSVIPQWLDRLRTNPHIICLLICPFWASATWWPLLIKMAHPRGGCLEIPPVDGMFTNCQGVNMPAPRWPLACVIVSGSFWNAKKCRLKTLKFTLKN